jgi:hypothetical protein
MKSKESSSLLDLDRDLPTSAEDIVALRQTRRRDTADLKTYFEFLSQFPAASTEELRAKKGPCGQKPFELKWVVGSRQSVVIFRGIDS